MAVGTLANIKVDPVAGTFTAKYTADATAAACSVFCGFTPRLVKITQIGGTLTNPVQSIFHESMTAANAITIGPTGAAALITAAGVTLLAGTEASPAAKATNSPESSGAGFTISTGVTGNSLVYLIEATR